MADYWGTWRKLFITLKHRLACKTVHKVGRDILPSRSWQIATARDSMKAVCAHVLCSHKFSYSCLGQPCWKNCWLSRSFFWSGTFYTFNIIYNFSQTCSLKKKDLNTANVYCSMSAVHWSCRFWCMSYISFRILGWKMGAWTVDQVFQGPFFVVWVLTTV